MYSGSFMRVSSALMFRSTSGLMLLLVLCELDFGTKLAASGFSMFGKAPDIRNTLFNCFVFIILYFCSTKNLPSLSSSRVKVDPIGLYIFRSAGLTERVTS
jgi:hypothetical protein